ncbi:MAG TPA: NUDIX domain-containing protein [Anaerolineales bacterium]|nr:NUDIX domain-containing protein [Anaerolineales bacterium]
MIDEILISVTFTQAVVGFLRDGNRICLGIRKKVSSGLGENLIAGIGGKVGDAPEIQDETPASAMDREANEEIGIRILEKQDMGRVRFIFTHKPLDSKWNQDVTIYSITKWEGAPSETESIQPVWFDLDGLPWERMWADNEYWLPRVLAGQHVDAVFLYSDDNKVADYRFEEAV